MDPVTKLIVQARVSLLFNKAFFGTLATRLALVECTWCKTIAVDGKHLFYNREWIKSLTEKELSFVLCHEVLHLVYDHLGRRAGRDKKIWNAATDYVINATLIHERVGDMPKGGLYDSRFTYEMSADEVYRLLMDDVEKGKLDPDSLDTIDEHLDIGGDGEGEGKKEGEGGVPGDGGKNPDGDPDPGDKTGVDYSTKAPVYTEEEFARLRNESRAAFINAIQSNQGNAPSHIVRQLNELVKPTIDWRELLTKSIQASFKEDYSFNQPSRRSWAINISNKRSGYKVMLPSQKTGQTIDICISLDTSGSISDEIFASFLSETVGICEQYEDYRLHVWCIDAAIYNPQVFTPDNINELRSYKPAGGGGNDFPLNWKYMMDNEITPELFVVFSDGYPCGSWGDPDYCDTIFVIRNEWDKNITAPFGLTVYMDT